MKTILLELQLNDSDVISKLISDYDDYNYAESAYHTVLASAAISNLAMHSAVLLGEDGNYIRSEAYKHHSATEKYIVLEIQVNSDGTVGTLTYDFDSNERKQAESTYYTVLASAALSQLPMHSAALLNETGNVIANKYYTHHIQESSEE